MTPPPSFPPRRYMVGHIGFSVLPLHEAVDLVLGLGHAIASGSLGHPGVAVHFCNAYNVALASDDSAYAAVLDGGDLVFSDGVPITWVGRRAFPAQARVWERVYGPDVMQGVLRHSTANGPRHYLLGSTPATLAALKARIAIDYPQAQIVGAASPPFRTATAAELDERDAAIRDSAATHVWVGLGTPKQDVEVARLASSLPVTALAVGAAFDFLAGTKAQAPAWVQRSGLEWAFRLASEPTRLGRRYVWGNTVFVREAIRTLRAPVR